MEIFNPVPITQLEKKFGPYLSGRGHPSCTISAISRVRSGSAEGSYLGVIGIKDNAEFFIQFPQPISLSGLTVRRNRVAVAADGISGLRKDGAQSAPGRKELFEAYKSRVEWETTLTKLGSGKEFTAEVYIPELGRKFAAVFKVSRSAGGKTKLALKGDLKLTNL